MLVDKKLKTIKCSSCGAELEIKNPRTKYISCQYCGTTTDLSGLTKDIKKGNPDSFKPLSFLKLGMIGKFNGIAYQIVGRTCWYNDYKEYDYEDSRFYNEKWSFDEWLLLSDEGTYMTLIEDKEGYAITKTITPTYPNLGNDYYIKNFYTEKSLLMAEYGKSIIQYFEGESTYLIEIGSYSEFSLYNVGKTAYMAEWRKKNGEIFEIEFFAENPIAKSELLEAFKQNEEVKEVFEKSKKEKKEVALRKKVFLFFGVINLIIAAIFGLKSSSFHTILFRSVTINQNNWSVLNDTMLYTTGEFDTVLSIKPKANTISYFTSCEFPKDSVEIISYLYLLDENNDTLSQFINYFYSYHKSSSTASKTQATVSLLPPKDGQEFKLAIRYEMPRPCLKRSGGTSVSYLFQDEGKNYQTTFAFLLGAFFLFIGFKVK